MGPLLLAVAAAADPFGFTPGTGPVDLDTRTDAPVWSDARECAGCHSDAAAGWAQSRHRVSWSNDLMQAGFVAEARLFCVYCHAPAVAQVAEVRANLETYRALSPHAPAHGPLPAALHPEPKAEEGITCVVCHLRDGEVLSAKPADPESPHPIRTDPSFGTEAACVTCHEFMAPSFVDGRTISTDQPMQATVQEWRQWQADSGRTEDCTDCHMPEGSHRMPGIHDHDRLRAAIDAAWVRGTHGWALRLAAVDVGHAVPTGDLFRHLTVEVQAPGATEWTTIATLGREFVVVEQGGVPVKREVSDTRLRPGTPIDLHLPDAQHGRVRVRCHLGGAHDEMRGLVAIEALVFTVYQWRFEPSPSGAPDKPDVSSRGVWHSEV